MHLDLEPRYVPAPPFPTADELRRALALLDDDSPQLDARIRREAQSELALLALPFVATLLALAAVVLSVLLPVEPDTPVGIARCVAQLMLVVSALWFALHVGADFVRAHRTWGSIGTVLLYMSAWMVPSVLLSDARPSLVFLLVAPFAFVALHTRLATGSGLRRLVHAAHDELDALFTERPHGRLTWLFASVGRVLYHATHACIGR